MKPADIPLAMLEAPQPQPKPQAPVWSLFPAGCSLTRPHAQRPTICRACGLPSCGGPVPN